MIIVDSREPNKIVSALVSKKLEIKKDFLEVGDYLLDNGYAIERKDKDLISSIQSNRLYEQLNNLCQYDHPILCITLNDLWKTFYFSRSRYIHRSYLGTLTTLTVKYPKLKVMFLQDEEEFISYVANLDKKIHENGKSERPAPHLRKAKSIKMRKENSLTAIEGVSIGKAKKLLECFGSIRNIANAKPPELEMVDGIGKKLAEKIRETLN